MFAAVAALLGAIVGGLLSVLASWLAQRVQSRTQLLTQEIMRRQQLYNDFVESCARCYADALQENEPEPGRLSRLYAEIGRMRLCSSDEVIEEAYGIVHKILEAYGGSNRTRGEIREYFAHETVDLFSGFAAACRAELLELEVPRPHRMIWAAWERASPVDLETVP
jgi:hypothetical protein